MNVFYKKYLVKLFTFDLNLLLLIIAPHPHHFRIPGSTVHSWPRKDSKVKSITGPNLSNEVAMVRPTLDRQQTMLNFMNRRGEVIDLTPVPNRILIDHPILDLNLNTYRIEVWTA